MNDSEFLIEDLGKAWLPKVSFKKKPAVSTTKPATKPTSVLPKPPVEMMMAKIPQKEPVATSSGHQTALDMASITPEVVALKEQGYRLLNTGSEFQAQQEFEKNTEKVHEKYADVKLVRISEKATKSGFIVAIMVKDKPVEVAVVNNPDGTTQTIVKPNPIKAMQLKFLAMPKNKQIMVGGAVAVGVGAIVLLAVKAKGGKHGQ